MNTEQCIQDSTEIFIFCGANIVRRANKMRSTGCLRKKYSEVDYQYFSNGNTQQYNKFIFRHTKCNFHLVVCEFLSNNVKHNLNYDYERIDGSNGTFMIK